MMDNEADFTGPVNLGNPNEISIRELAERILRLTGSSSAVVFEPLPHDDPTRRRPDIALARDVLDWQPTCDLDEGLKNTIGYFRTILEATGSSD